MQVVKIILLIIYFIVCVGLIILAMVQSKEDAGLSSTITGSSANNFFEKNKGNTKEGRQKKVDSNFRNNTCCFMHCTRSCICNIKRYFRRVELNYFLFFVFKKYYQKM